MKAKIPQDLEDLANDTMLAAALKKEDLLICESLKTSGSCQNPLTCFERHRFHPSLDRVGEDREGSSEIHFKVTHVFQPNRYYGRIQRILKTDGSAEDLATGQLQIALKLLTLKEGKLPPRVVHPRVGAVVVTKDRNEGCFKRAEVMEVTSWEISGKSTKKAVSIKILFIDHGNVESARKVEELFEVKD